MNYPLFVAFYTPSYAAYKERLEASLQRHSLPYVIDEVKDLGSWEKNSLFKAEFLEEKIKEGPLCYIDADAEVVASPNLLMNIESDSAFGFFMADQKRGTILTAEEYIDAAKKGSWPCKIDPFFHIEALKLQMRSKGALLSDFAPQLQSGLIYLKKNERVIALIERWKELCREKPEKLDGNLLQEAVRESSVSITFLPLTYLYIKDLIEPLIDAPPVVIQHQASREMR